MDDEALQLTVEEFIEWYAAVLVHRFKEYCETPTWRILRRHNLKRRILLMKRVGVREFEQAGLGPLEVKLTKTETPKWLR